jgi:hypothetical protein
MSGSGLAAVHAAAHSDQPAPAPAATVSKQPAATTAAELVAAYPDLCAAIRLEAATAERTRIMGIAALADAGNASLIAELQADSSVTPGDAAMRVIAAQKVARGQQLQAIVDVEKTTGAVRPAPTSTAAAPAPAKTAATPDGWKTEWANSESLQAEFGTAEAYVAYQQGSASGRIKIKAS